VAALDLDDRFRAAALAYVSNQSARLGGRVGLAELESFNFEGRRVPLIHRQRGIRKVPWLEAAVSIMTTFAPRPDMRPYDDGVGPDGYQRYKWRGNDPLAWDNIALRRAMEWERPLIWLYGVAPGLYAPIAPVWLVHEEPEQQQFVVAVDEAMRDQWTDVFHPVDLVARRQYAEVVIRQRVHQRVFRQRVLIAYNSQCALCRLRHPELLDAAHIKEDADGGEPVVPNGVSMCAIHHRAFDHNVIGIRPDYVLQVRPDVLEEHDGPTLRHSLQGLHGETLTVPASRRARPDRDLLEERFARFLRAG
jgi:putative restriction endonuclease